MTLESDYNQFILGAINWPVYALSLCLPNRPLLPQIPKIHNDKIHVQDPALPLALPVGMKEILYTKTQQNGTIPAAAEKDT